MNVLVVDDHPENRYFLETLLRGNGTTVASASNGEEALQMARDGNYDLIVSDVLMPHMDGFELCRQVRANPELRSVRFVFYTATYTDPKDLAFGMELGADRYLIKPIEPQELYTIFLDVMAKPARKNKSTPGDESANYLKHYNSRLIAKLEKKTIDLEKANQALQEELEARTRLEEQLRQTHKMEAVGRLAGGIAHDFNNILGGIVGYTELARFEVEKPEAVLTHLDGIIAATNRARELVYQILTFSRQKERKRLPINLPAALDDAFKLLRASIPATVEIRREFSEDLPAILADLTEVHQLATNLVTNAWHAIGTQSNGVITIEAAPATVTAGDSAKNPELVPGEYVRLTVRDTGCGIGSETLDHIFEPFFTTKAVGKGCGLGLSVVHGIMKACDGAIVVESQLGKGTAFHLYFPAYPLESETEPLHESAPMIGRGERVLFIDDDTTLSSLGGRFLEKLGYDVESETDPSRALTRFREKSFDLVLTDLSMPVMSGLDFARECRKIRPSVPIILMTGFNPTLQRDDLLSRGIIDIILKPYGIQTLSDAMRTVFAKEPAATR